MDRLLLTGASGFVGKEILSRLCNSSAYKLRTLSRRVIPDLPANVEMALIDDLSTHSDFSKELSGVKVVIHAAGRAHILDEKHQSPASAYRNVNVNATLSLANQAIKSHVKRFIYISTIKVNGESTPAGIPYTADDLPAPQDAYARSKYEAEQELLALKHSSKMEIVIIRPPLIYGPGVKANFLSLLDAIARGVPFPLGSIRNRRSLIALDNLVDLIVTCVYHPAAANQIFLASDGDDISTPDLVRRMAQAMGRSARLLPIPPSLLILGASFLGKHNKIQRVCESLQIDIGKTRELLGWTPPISIDEGLAKVARWYIEQGGIGNS